MPVGGIGSHGVSAKGGNAARQGGGTGPGAGAKAGGVGGGPGPGGKVDKSGAPAASLNKDRFVDRSKTQTGKMSIAGTPAAGPVDGFFARALKAAAPKALGGAVFGGPIGALGGLATGIAQAAFNGPGEGNATGQGTGNSITKDAGAIKDTGGGWGGFGSGGDGSNANANASGRDPARTRLAREIGRLRPGQAPSPQLPGGSPAPAAGGGAGYYDPYRGWQTEMPAYMRLAQALAG